MLIKTNQSPFLRRAAQNFRLSVLVITLGLVVAVTLLSSHHAVERPVTERGHTHASETLGFAKFPKPTVEIVNGTEIIWETPDDPKAVLFVAHGCGGSPRNFWVRCLTCPKCVGLPEESKIVLDALAHKYAVLVVSSTKPCWTYGQETIRVSDIIRWWLEKNGLVQVPLVGLGASSGGLYDQMDSIPSGYPPTLFVHMPKDFERAIKVDSHIKILRKAGVEVEEIKCMEIPLTTNWLAERVPGLDRKMSSKLFEAFLEKGYIDPNGYMKNDGRVTPWREVLKENNIALPFMPPVRQYIQEELNLAYGYHEMTSLQSNEIFQWLDSHIK
ncbi:hypothetical protein Cgig2_021757 [Carnegiea gigantea]|uniref:Uncharacterized protein n=1 Tax=Carnegiea gigantea TaxID=171969 RepID=A0A9Q1JRZ4_9CARY|nr:hypothetical protein Cgig2_021757 [Carnegiea gigantea]